MSAAIFRKSANGVRAALRTRAFTSTQASRKDIVQELYLKELRGYKPAPVPKDAHVGVVKTFSQPMMPKPPTLPSDIAAELASYDAADPVRAPDTHASSESGIGSGAEAYLSFLEQDGPPKEEAHH